MIPFESDNSRAYSLLLRIEVVLREFLRSTLESEHGSHWRKKLPGDLLTRIRQSQTEEFRPHFDFVRLGPLYYLTFGELLTLLQQKPSKLAVEQLGGDCIVKQLENILTPRNAVCHSRPVSQVGLKAIEALYAQIETALTPNVVVRLVAQPDTGLAQPDAAKLIIPSLHKAMQDLSALPVSLVVPVEFYTASIQYWWADDILAGFSRPCVETAIKLICSYNVLPTGVGSAAHRQRFSEEFELIAKIQRAVAELEKVR